MADCGCGWARQVGISMLQIVACVNDVYSIPWPPNFSSFLDILKVFLVDVLTVTKANCAVRFTYFQSTLLTLMVFKGARFVEWNDLDRSRPVVVGACVALCVVATRANDVVVCCLLCGSLSSCDSP